MMFTSEPGVSSDVINWLPVPEGKAGFDIFDLPLFGANDHTELGEVVVEGPGKDDDPYDDWWENGGGGSGSSGGDGGGGGGEGGEPAEPPQSLGPDLRIYNCAMLAQKEADIRASQSALREAVVISLNVTEWGNGRDVYNELYARFQELEDQGRYDPQNPAANAAQVAGQSFGGSDLISMTLRGIGINLTITGTQLNLIQSTFAMQQNLERIDAEQARRGGCGS